MNNDLPEGYVPIGQNNRNSNNNKRSSYSDNNGCLDVFLWIFFFPIMLIAHIFKYVMNKDK